MQTASLIVQIVLAVLYGVGLWMAYLTAIRQTKNANDIAMNQSRNEFFAEYTRRYQDIILNMPD